MLKKMMAADDVVLREHVERSRRAPLRSMRIAAKDTAWVMIPKSPKLPSPSVFEETVS